MWPIKIVTWFHKMFTKIKVQNYTSRHEHESVIVFIQSLNWNDARMQNVDIHKKASLKHNRNIFLVFVCHLFRSLSTKIKVIQTISEWSFVTFSIIFRDSSPFSAPFSKHCPHSCHESFTRAWRYSFRKYLDSKISMHKSHHPDILEDWDCQEKGCEGCGTRHWLVNQEPWSGCFLVSRWWIIANIENENCIIQRVLNRGHNWQSTLRRSTDRAQKYEGAFVNEYAENTAASRLDKTDLDNDELNCLAPVPVYLAPHLSWNHGKYLESCLDLTQITPHWSTPIYDGCEIICVS